MRLSRPLIAANVTVAICVALLGVSTGTFRLADILFGFTAGIALAWIAADSLMTRANAELRVLVAEIRKHVEARDEESAPTLRTGAPMDDAPPTLRP